MAQTPDFSRLLARVSDTPTYLFAVDTMDDETFEALDERLNDARSKDDLSEDDRAFIERCEADLAAGRDGDWYQRNGFERWSGDEQ